MVETLIKLAYQHDAVDARMVGDRLRVALIATKDGKYDCTIIEYIQPRFDSLALILGY